LPDSDGIDALTHIRTQAPTLPIIVLTGLSDETLAVKAISLGAQDYLVKGNFDADSLYRAIRYSIERQRLETDRERLINAEYSHKVAFLMGEYWYSLPLLMHSHRHAYKTLSVFYISL
jgi:DNA-binding response OmpR family regulator